MHCGEERVSRIIHIDVTLCMWPGRFRLIMIVSCVRDFRVVCNQRCGYGVTRRWFSSKFFAKLLVEAFEAFDSVRALATRGLPLWYYYPWDPCRG